MIVFIILIFYTNNYILSLYHYIFHSKITFYKQSNSLSIKLSNKFIFYDQIYHIPTLKIIFSPNPLTIHLLPSYPRNICFKTKLSHNRKTIPSKTNNFPIHQFLFLFDRNPSSNSSIEFILIHSIDTTTHNETSDSQFPHLHSKSIQIFFFHFYHDE